MENKQNKQKENAEQSNINNHSNFENFIFESLKCGGSHVVASKSHGKSRLLFSVFERLQKESNVRCIAFDGSETWLYCASKVEAFSIGEHDILAVDRTTTDEIERYTLRNWQLVKTALDTHKDILFRLKTRKPSKRGFFVRTIVNYLDALQREEKQRNPNHENSKVIAYFIEEAQDCFSSKSSASRELEEFLTVFNEGRNQKEAFFTASQRLTDFSKTIRSKQQYCIGKIASEDITPSLKRLEKKHSVSFENMPQKTCFFNGSIFVSPEFKQNGKPFIINKAIKEKWLKSLPKEKTLSLKEKIRVWLNPQTVAKKTAFAINSFMNPSANLPQPKSDRNLTQEPNSFFESVNNPDSENIDSESEIEIDESEEYPKDWGI